MTEYGVTVLGFINKSLTNLLDEIKASERSTISSTLNLLASSVLGKINGIFADQLNDLWNLGLAVYRSQYPDSASGEALDQVCSITGVTRLDADYSTVTLDRMYLNDGVEVAAGSVVSVGLNGARFETLATIKNETGLQANLSVAARSESTGPVVGTAGTIDAIQTPISGWLDTPGVTGANHEPFDLGVAPPNKTLEIEVDGGTAQVVTFLLGPAVPAETVRAQILAAVTGIDCKADGGYVRCSTLTSRGSIRVSGGTAAAILGFTDDLYAGFNSADAVVGRNVETDPELRIRREDLLRATSTSTVDSIRTRLLEIEDVLQVAIDENDTDYTSISGVPPHAFEAIVRGGVGQTIADTIWANKPAGIATHGDDVATVYDAMGDPHQVNYSRPTSVPIYFAYTVLVDPRLFPADGMDLIKTAVVDEGMLLNTGDDVIALRFHALPLDVVGVIDVTAYALDTIPTPSGTANIPIDIREIAEIDGANVAVTVIT